MTDHAFTAQILRSSARGLSSLAAERLLPRVKTRLADDVHAGWREHLDGRLTELALALDEGRPATFLDQIAWAKVAFASRSLEVDDLRVSLECLHEVVADELPADVGAPVLKLLTTARADFDALAVEAAPSGLEHESPTRALTTRYMLAVLEGDRRGASQLVLDAVTSGELTVTEALLDVVMLAQRELGRMWHANEISVAEEHVVSATAARLIGQLGALAPVAEPHGKVVLCAALMDDEHDLGLRVLAELFEVDGWRSVLVGGRLPVEELAGAIERFGADLLLLSASLDSHRSGLASAIADLRAGGTPRAALPILVGGPAFVGREDAAGAVGADACVTHARDVLGVARGLVGLDGA